MTIKQLQFFKKSAELENFSKAAEELYIAQPALSKSIKDLEKELGYPLFERKGKRIILNQNGEILYKYVLHMQNDISHMENELREANAQKLSCVNVSVRVASRILPTILSSFYKKYPDANLKVCQLNQDVKTTPVYDIIIDSQLTNDFYDQDISLLMEERILLALPCSHPLTAKQNILLSDLAKHPCCLMNEFSSLGKSVRTVLSTEHFIPNIIFESDNPHMIRDFLRLNISYSFVPEKTWLIKEDFPNLVLREVKDFSCNRYIFIKYAQNIYVSQIAKEFMKHVKDYFNQELL